MRDISMNPALYLLFLSTVTLYIFQANSSESTSTESGGAKSEEKTSELCGHTCRAGRDGRDGRDGIQGPYGPPGPPGEKGLPGESCSMHLRHSLETIADRLTEKISTTLDRHLTEGILKILDEHSSLTNRPPKKSSRFDGSSPEQTSGTKIKPEQTTFSVGGAVYTRWGRKVCPDHADMLYAGIMAGPHYQHVGAGSNHLCLPRHPQWNKTYAGRQSSLLYGTELELTEANAIFRTTNSGGTFPHDRDVQCAVCYTPGRPSHVMIPARLECPAGWAVEYLGFLMAAHHTHKKANYVCVDQDPDTHPATSANTNGNLLYKVEAACGALPCPEYVDGYELTCIVCTK